MFGAVAVLGITQRVIRRGSFASVMKLVQKIDR
jgi:hypothetical protein